MKKLICILIVMITSLSVYGETVMPIYTTVERSCASVDIEGEIYNDCAVSMKSWIDNFMYDHRPTVKVIIKDVKGKTLYKKKFEAYMYIFSNGQIQVGNPDVDKIIIYPHSGRNDMVIRM